MCYVAIIVNVVFSTHYIFYFTFCLIIGYRYNLFIYKILILCILDYFLFSV